MGQRRLSGTEVGSNTARNIENAAAVSYTLEVTTTVDIERAITIDDRTLVVFTTGESEHILEYAHN